MSERGKYNNPFSATMKGITDLYGKKQIVVALPEQIDLTGKIVMIIGSSSGLGFAAAKRIAKAGAGLVLAVRSGIPGKGEEIIKATGNKNVIMYHVDLLDFNSINQLLIQLENDRIQVDILISNAAMVPLKSRKTPQGLEEMFMVNYLAPFYLINRLLQKGILKQDQSKIIIISSESHRNQKEFDWENFGKYHDYGMNETVPRYGYFKLLLTTFGNELSRRVNSGQVNIPVRMLCPGPVNSNIAREAPGWLQPVLKGVFSLFFRSPEKASEPIIYFVTEEYNSSPVDYLFLMQPKSMDERAINEENGKKLWWLSEKLCKQLGFPLNT